MGIRRALSWLWKPGVRPVEHDPSRSSAVEQPPPATPPTSNLPPAWLSSWN